MYFLSKNFNEFKYKSINQNIRYLSESWVNENIFCPQCGNKLIKYENNKPVADFYCKNCQIDFELKSKKNNVSSMILDGNFYTMIERLNSERNPNLFLLTYKPKDLAIKDFFTIPKYYFTPEIIIKRKPLSQLAKRS